MSNPQQLTKNFHSEEFACRCCGDDRMAIRVVERLEKARQVLGRAIRISSGVRCPEYNRTVGGSLTSSHLVILRDGLLEACAIDLDVYDAHYGYKLFNALVTVGFDRIGLRSKGDHRFIHTDRDEDKSSQVLWTYA